jgi:uncharacterized protein (TIGR02246 family)
MPRLRPVLAASLVLLASCRPSQSGLAGISSHDSTAIRGVQDAYVKAWLADDTAGVLATLTPQAVLLPPRTLPVTGHAAIRSFWWPQDGSRTRITSFDWDIQELGGHQSLAFTRGISAVAWTYDKDTLHQISSSRSVNLSVLTRQPDGRWLISHQMWGPPLP